MTLHTFKRHVRESIKSLGRNGWMTFASASAVTVTLLLVGVFFVVMFNINHFAQKVENDVEIRVHIELTADNQQKNALRRQIEAIPNVKEVRYSSKDEELKRLIKSMGEEGSSFRLFEQDNPLSDVYVVKAAHPQDTVKIAKQIETLPFVHKVNYGQGTVEKLFDALKVARNVGLVLILGLLFTAMFLISNTIKITILARRREISIMKMVGATNSFIRWPFFVEGALLGIIGSLIPIVVLLVGYDSVVKAAQLELGLMMIRLIPVREIGLDLSALLLGIGVVIGVWGSTISIRKFLKV